MGNVFRYPQQTSPGIHLQVMCWDGAVGAPPEPRGPAGIGAAIALPGVLSGVRAARNKLGNDGWEAGEAVKSPARLR